MTPTEGADKEACGGQSAGGASMGRDGIPGQVKRSPGFRAKVTSFRARLSDNIAKVVLILGVVLLIMGLWIRYDEQEHLQSLRGMDSYLEQFWWYSGEAEEIVQSWIYAAEMWVLGGSLIAIAGASMAVSSLPFLGRVGERGKAFLKAVAGIGVSVAIVVISGGILHESYDLAGDFALVFIVVPVMVCVVPYVLFDVDVIGWYMSLEGSGEGSESSSSYVSSGDGDSDGFEEQDDEEYCDELSEEDEEWRFRAMATVGNPTWRRMHRYPPYG